MQAPSYDTIGWFARDAATFARVGRVVFDAEIAAAAPERVVIAEDLFDAADPEVAAALRPAAERIAAMAGRRESLRLAPEGLDGWASQQNILQSIEAWETLKDWIDATNPRFSYWVTERYTLVASLTGGAD